MGCRTLQTAWHKHPLTEQTYNYWYQCITLLATWFALFSGQPIHHTIDLYTHRVCVTCVVCLLPGLDTVSVKIEDKLFPQLYLVQSKWTTCFSYFLSGIANHGLTQVHFNNLVFIPRSCLYLIQDLSNFSYPLCSQIFPLNPSLAKMTSPTFIIFPGDIWWDRGLIPLSPNNVHTEGFLL